MGYFSKKAHKEIINYLKKTKKLIKVIPGKCRYNYRCQMNAVHEAIENNENALAMCMYIHDKRPMIHFVNINENGEYVDNTLGHWATQYEYYLIKIITKNKFFSIDDIFGKYRKKLQNRLSILPNLFYKGEF